MSSAGKWVMWTLLVILAVAMLKNAAGTVGIMLAGGTEGVDVIDALGGQGKNTNTGTFKSGGTTIKLAG